MKIKCVMLLLMISLALPLNLSFAEVLDLPDSVSNYLETPETAMHLQEAIDGSIAEIKSAVANSVKLPFSMLSGLVFVAAAASVADKLSMPATKAASGFTIGVFSAAAMIGTTLGSINSYLNEVSETMDYAKNFFEIYTPTLTGVLVAAGKPGSAAVLAAFLSAISGFVFSAASALLPAVGSSMVCLSASGAVGDGLSAEAASSLKRLLCWIIAAASAVCIGVFKLQFSAAGISDSLVFKTGRYVVGQAVPLVGKTISGAMSSMMASSAAAGSAAAIIGVLSLAVRFLPLIVTGLCISAVMRIAGFVSEFVGVKPASGLLAALRSAVDVNTAFLSSFFTVIILAFGTTLKIGSGT